MSDISTTLKRLFRPLFYRFTQGKSITISHPQVLQGLKWVIDSRFGRAYYKGYYEVEMVNFLVKHFNDGNVFLDIGGHAGYFSYVFSRLSPNGQVLTFEPDSQNAQFIRQIIKMNNITNIVLLETAVGREQGTMFFEQGSSSSMGKVSDKGAIPMEVTSIDNILSELKRVDLIKIDVEGFGGKVIEGARETIGKYNPTILMELHDHSDERKTLATLAENGYEFYNFNGDVEDIWCEDCRFYVATRANRLV